MSSNTKIVVLRSKELVYALVLLVVSVLIIMVAVSLFMPSENDTSAKPVPTQNTDENTSGESTVPDDSTTGMLDTYVPGIYASTLMLGSANVELQIAVDKDHINSITLSNIDESVATLYPLVSPTLSELSSAILADQSIDNIIFSDENRYTSMLLMQTISATLDKARVSEDANLPESSSIY